MARQFTDAEKADLHRARLLRAQAKSCEEEAKEILAGLDLVELDSYAVGSTLVKVERNARFDPARAQQELSDEEFEKILVPTPNGTVAKELFGEDRYRKMQKEGAPKVTLTQATDYEED